MKTLLTALVLLIFPFTVSSQTIDCTSQKVGYQFFFENGTSSSVLPYSTTLSCEREIDPEKDIHHKLKIVEQYQVDSIFIKKVDLNNCSSQEAINQLFYAFEYAMLFSRNHDTTTVFLQLPRFFDNVIALEESVIIGNHPEYSDVKILIHFKNIDRMMTINESIKIRQMDYSNSESGEIFYNGEKELLRMYAFANHHAGNKNYLLSYLPN